MSPPNPRHTAISPNDGKNTLSNRTPSGCASVVTAAGGDWFEHSHEASRADSPACPPQQQSMGMVQTAESAAGRISQKQTATIGCTTANASAANPITTFAAMRDEREMFIDRRRQRTRLGNVITYPMSEGFMRNEQGNQKDHASRGTALSSMPCPICLYDTKLHPNGCI